MKFKIFLFVTVLILGCGNPSGPTINPFESFTYPLEVGNVWTYDYTQTFSNIIPDTATLPAYVEHIDTFSIFVSGVESLGVDNEVFAINSDDTTITPRGNVPLETRHFYNKQDGMYEYGSSHGTIPLPISTPVIEDELKKLFKDKKLKTNYSQTSLDTLVKKLIQYPITLNDEWVYTDTAIGGLDIHKKIESFQYIEIHGKRYYCFVVEWIYGYVINISVKDYYSQIGLVKRTMTAKNLTISDESNMEIASGDLTLEYNLQNFINANK